MSQNILGKKKSILQRIWTDRQLLILLLPGLLFYIIFRYGPMYGMIIAFKKYSPFLGVAKSPFVGFKYFEQLFTGSDFFMLFKNTLLLGVLKLALVFPMPIIFALMLNEVKNAHSKKFFQTVSYLPSFLSLVIICSMFIDLFSINSGLINKLIVLFGGEKINFMVLPQWYLPVYILSDIWAGLGSGAIIYLSALSAVDPQLYEAAKIDGCTRFRMIFAITVPSILPTIITMFLLQCGSIMSIAADKALLLYNPMTYSVADIFSTYTYRVGIANRSYSFGTAVGMVGSVLSALVLLFANNLSKKTTGNSLW